MNTIIHSFYMEILDTHTFLANQEGYKINRILYGD